MHKPYRYRSCRCSYSSFAGSQILLVDLPLFVCSLCLCGVLSEAFIHLQALIKLFTSCKIGSGVVRASKLLLFGVFLNSVFPLFLCQTCPGQKQVREGLPCSGLFSFILPLCYICCGWLAAGTATVFPRPQKKCRWCDSYVTPTSGVIVLGN